jgi:hypothetical protein
MISNLYTVIRVTFKMCMSLFNDGKGYSRKKVMRNGTSDEHLVFNFRTSQKPLALLASY